MLLEGGLQQAYAELLLSPVKSNVIAIRSMCISGFQQITPNQYRASLQNTQGFSGVFYTSTDVVGAAGGSPDSNINANRLIDNQNGLSMNGCIPISDKFQWFGYFLVNGADSLLGAPNTSYGQFVIAPPVHWDVSVVENFEVFIQLAYHEV